MALGRIQRSTSSGDAGGPPRSRAFFLEMLLNMLIFALCAVVALQVFVEAKINTNESAALTRLSLEAESLAEQYKTSSEPMDSTSTIIYYYNSDFDETTDADAPYSIVLTQRDTSSMPAGVRATSIEGFMRTADIDAAGAATRLFGFEVVNYQPRGGA